MANTLQHHGIRGMRWGVRRTPAQLSRDHIRSRALMKRKTSSLSNDELKELNRRLQMEQQYSNVKPNHIKKGMHYIKTITAIGGGVAGIYGMGMGVARAANSPAAKQVKHILKAKVGK